MDIGLVELLNMPVWRAYDIDDSGRILAGSDASGTTQLVELAADGTQTPLTALPGACRGRYLPGARTRAVVVEHDQDGDERAQLSLLTLDPVPPRPVGLEGLTPLVRDPRYLHNLTAVAEGRVVYTTNRRNDVDFDVVILDVDAGRESVVYDSGGVIDWAAVAPNGVDAVLVRYSDRPMSKQLVLVGPSAGAEELRELTGSDEHAQHRLPQWTPDGGSLIVTSDRDREFSALLRLDTVTGEWTELVSDARHDVSGWLSPDGRRLLVHTNVDGATRLSVHDAGNGREISQASLPGAGWAGGFPVPDPVWSPGSRFAVLSFTGPSVPGDVLRLDVETGEVVTVASSTQPLAGITLAEPATHRVPTRDGEFVPCFVYRDPGAAAAEPAESLGSNGSGRSGGSAVVHVHGGPEGQATLTFNPLIQGLAAAGHTVLVPNVRGSIGYGKRWYSADDVRLRLDSVADLAALHAWLPQLGVDQSRAALWGGSYGGYMVLAGLAFQPELWAAGVDIVGISSLVTFLENTSTYRRAIREREYGSLERDRDFLEAASPLNRVEDMRAPLIVIHGANDPRVPLAEAKQIAAALESKGVECELLVFQDEGHGLAKRENRLEAYTKAAAFLGRVLSR
jgi:dipeptidyl aminopeptidase/acylaminoacyl peptidase